MGVPRQADLAIPHRQFTQQAAGPKDDTSRVSPDDEDILFLTNHGERFSPNALSGLVARYIKNADIGKTGSCHLFRHTCATLMLENGADVRYIQAMLGHAKLETTAIYTQVSIKQLKDVHSLTHPAGKSLTGAKEED